ncbi:MAG: polyphenol oxidase family protein [Candidatus Liptonbacteria bacterium]|nr:polyphenol oxidase family protein [Candidatus Liptonbacteria bacterium]
MYQLDKLKNVQGLIHGFSELKDGNMSFVWGEREKVLSDRKAFLDKLGIKFEDSVAMFLKHGTEIMSVNEFSRGEDAMPVDCLITKSKNVFLFVLTADCLPVIFYDPDNGVLALAHLSRINSPKNFLLKIIQKMESEYSSKPGNLIAAIGPCIHKESYVFIKEELKRRIPDEKAFSGYIADLPDGRKSIDLVGYNFEQMVLTGIKKENIEISGIDTAKNEEFFSHYHSRLTGSPEGRIATVVGMI